MRRLALLIAALALGAGTAQAATTYHYTASNCANAVCTQKLMRNLGFPSSFPGIYNGGWSGSLPLPVDNVGWSLWLEKPAVPAGCVLVSANAFFHNDGGFHELGTLAPTTKACGGSRLPTAATQMETA